jgi:hypothetical protein
LIDVNTAEWVRRSFVAAAAFGHDGIEAAQLIDRDAVHCRFFQQTIAIFCSF